MPSFPSTAALAVAAAVSLGAPAHATESLPEPRHAAVSGPDTAAVLLAARRYAAFWNTGDAVFAKAALAPDFTDHTLPPGRPQGVTGPLQASTAFRGAVPDLSASIEDIVVTGDRAAVHYRFQGHFTGRFGDLQGRGQTVDFQAFDLYRVQDGRITDNWHLEDNLTLLRQLGVITQ